MSFTSEINQKLNLHDTYISIRINNEKANVSELVTNVPNDFRETYYHQQYNRIDDTFEQTEKRCGKLCFPNTQNSDYQSQFLPILESHSLYNLASFSIGDNLKLTCVITLTNTVENSLDKFLSMRDDVIEWCKVIADDYCKLANSSDFDFSQVPIK
ncbi:hypothetical protein [Vibrio marisflavi]|uniref:Uncharacterized protein n=1 Tax=Vibrio marisflavi CECT 7928 TaxID=634439 RepID=A0ABM8ZZN0_9VIBR|nr:hypothetical protein [Vibrio marisflavi]CAH0536389.1 hypothetical protein VMF7928_00398 [Vibrio marisflavi CECT 7928]